MKFYRLCHSCNHMNSSDKEIEQCHKCTRYFLKFYFCEELEEFLPTEEEVDLTPQKGKSRTILGLCFKWTEQS